MSFDKLEKGIKNTRCSWSLQCNILDIDAGWENFLLLRFLGFIYFDESNILFSTFSFYLYCCKKVEIILKFTKIVFIKTKYSSTLMIII